MKEIVLTKTQNTHATVLGEALAQAQLLRVRMYYTYVFVPTHDTKYQICTTSKELHLRLGQLNEQARESLVILLSLQLEMEPEGVLLFENEERNGGLFATLSQVTRKLRVLNLSIAR